MDPRIVIFVAFTVGVVSAAPMNMKNIRIIMNNTGLVWNDADPTPLYEYYQNKVWGCGRGWSLHPWKKFTLTSEGQVAKGNCATKFTVTKSSSCQNKVCVNPEKIRIDRNGIRITFSNMVTNETKTLTSTDKTMQRTCFTGNTLMVNVVTESSVALPSNDFDFKFEIYSHCPGIPKDMVMESDKDSKEVSGMAEFHKAEMENLIYGIVTAGCICVVFLIILTITYCYSRNNPDVKRKRHTEETEPLRK